MLISFIIYFQIKAVYVNHCPKFIIKFFLNLIVLHNQNAKLIHWFLLVLVLVIGT